MRIPHRKFKQGLGVNNLEFYNLLKKKMNTDFRINLTSIPICHMFLNIYPKITDCLKINDNKALAFSRHYAIENLNNQFVLFHNTIAIGVFNPNTMTIDLDETFYNPITIKQLQKYHPNIRAR